MSRENLWDKIKERLGIKPRRRRRVRPVGNVADRMERLLLYILALVIGGSICFMAWRSM